MRAPDNYAAGPIAEAHRDAAAFIAALPKRLIKLAARLKAKHEAAVASMRRSFAAALDAGDILVEAKERLRHGEWLPWLKLASVPQRTARRYMEFARNRAVFEDQSGHVADLTVREAYDLLAVLPGKRRQKSRGDPADLTKPLNFVAPFSVIDTTTKEWQSRKRAWLALGIQPPLPPKSQVFRQNGLNMFLTQRGGLAAALWQARPEPSAGGGDGEDDAP